MVRKKNVIKIVYVDMIRRCDDMNFNTKHNGDMVVGKTIYETLSPTIDMSEIYFSLTLNPRFDWKNCPALFCDINLPDSFDYITTVLGNKPVLLYTRKGLSNDDILKIVIGETKTYKGLIQNLPIEFDHPSVTGYMTVRDNSLFWSLGALLAKSMQIRCPQIFVMNESLERAQNNRGNCFNAPGVFGKTTHIEIYDHLQCSTIEMLETLAHEMRHCWQREKNPHRFFSKYKDVTRFQQEELENYYLQSAEIDARAYALRFVKASTGNNNYTKTVFPKVNKKIETYAESLDDSLFLTFEDMYKYTDLG